MDRGKIDLGCSSHHQWELGLSFGTNRDNAPARGGWIGHREALNQAEVFHLLVLKFVLHPFFTLSYNKIE